MSAGEDIVFDNVSKFYGEVLGVKGYGRTDYSRAFASANTVVVNGYSRGEGGWIGVGINTVQVEAMEPAARANLAIAVSGH